MASVKKAVGGEALPSLATVLSKIAKRRGDLDTLDTKLTESVTTLEEKLRNHISTRVSTVIQEGDPFDDQERLIFGKWDGRWQFLIETGGFDSPENWKTQPLVNASREMRVRVFTGGFMEKLVREAEQQLEAQIAEREKAMKVASNLIEALGPEGGPDDDIPF